MVLYSLPMGNRVQEAGKTTHEIPPLSGDPLGIAVLPNVLAVRSGYPLGIKVENPSALPEFVQKLESGPDAIRTLLFTTLKKRENEAREILNAERELRGQESDNRSFLDDMVGLCSELIHAQRHGNDATVSHVHTVRETLVRVQVVTSEVTANVYPVADPTIGQRALLFACMNEAARQVLAAEFEAGNAAQWGFESADAQDNPIAALNTEHRRVHQIVESSLAFFP